MFSVNDLQYGGFKYNLPTTGVLTLKYSFNIFNHNFTFSDSVGKEEIQNQSLYVHAINNWGRIIDKIEFQENDNNQNITLFKTDFTNGDIARTRRLPGSDPSEIVGADIAIDKSIAEASTPYSYFAALHEIGHALGLSHPNNDPNNAAYNTNITVTSYVIPDGRHAFTPMALDILTIEDMYGDLTYNSLDTSYNYVPNTLSSLTFDEFNGSKRSQTIVDSGGIDTFDVSSYTSGGVFIDLRQSIDDQANWYGHHSIIGEEHVYIAHNTVIEHAIGGSGGDFIVGNDANNSLMGGAGDDELYGVGGTNILDGGADLDTVNYQYNTSYITVDLNAGTDSLGNTLISIEGVKLGAGGGNVIGSGSANFIQGGDFADTLYGGGGSDILSGGAGNDDLSISNSDGEYSYVDGGDGVDRFSFSQSTNALVGQNSVQTESSYAENVEIISLGTVGNSIYSNALGFTYDAKNNTNISWVDYSSSISALNVDTTLTNWTVQNSANDTDVFINAANGHAKYIGSTHGDNIVTGTNNNATYWLGTGNDTVDITNGVNAKTFLYYSGGNDTVNRGLGVNRVTFDASITDSDVSFSSARFGSVIDNGNSRTYNIHLTANVSGKGSITLNNLKETVYAGADGVFGNSDDIYSRTGPIFYLLNGSRYDKNTNQLIGADNLNSVKTTPFGAPVLTGTVNGETLAGYGQSDTINGGGGDDVLNGNGGDDILNGNAGNDVILGGLGNDTLNGGAGDDRLYAGAGDDTLDGGLGDDRIYGGAGDDILISSGTGYVYGGFGDDNITIEGTATRVEGEQGNDTLISGSNANQLKGGEGDDTLIGNGGNDVLTGDEGNDDLNGGDDDDQLLGGDGDDQLLGGDGDDRLYGDEGDDTLNGGSGRDILQGGAGDDIYVFETGFGSSNDDNIIVEDLGDVNQIQFESGINESDVYTWVDSAENLNIQVGESSDNRIVVSAQADTVSLRTDIGQRISQISFFDGTIWDMTAGLSLKDTDDAHSVYGTEHDDTIKGNGGDDRLYGYEGDDVLEGGEGVDDLYGGLGDDTYVFNVGFGSDAGQDKIYEDVTSGEVDKILFGASITSSDVSFSMAGTDLVVKVGNNPDDIFTIEGEALVAGGSQATASGSDVLDRVEEIEFHNGDVINLSNGVTFDASSAFTGTSYNDTVYITDDSGSISVITGYGDDVIYSGQRTSTSGRHQLFGGDGNDTYVIEKNAGKIIVNENGSDGVDTVQFGTGILPSDLEMFSDRGNILIRFKDDLSSNHIVTIVGDASVYETNVGQYLEKITFVDDPGTVWDLTGGLEFNNVTNPSSAPITGTEFDDVINSSQGGVSGGAGDDVINSLDYIGVVYSEAPNGIVFNESGNAQSYDLINIAANTVYDGDGGTDTLTGYFRSFIGSEFDDVIWLGERNPNSNLWKDASSGAGNDVVFGGDWNDHISDGEGDDIVYGGLGNDVFINGDGNDYFDGGTGRDQIGLHSGKDFIANLDSETKSYNNVNINANSILDNQGYVDTFTNIDSIGIGSGNDVFLMGDTDIEVNGYFGNNIFVIDERSTHTKAVASVALGTGNDTILISSSITRDDFYLWGAAVNFNITIGIDSANKVNFFTQHSGGANISGFENLAFDNGNGILDENDEFIDLTKEMHFRDTNESHALYGGVYDDTFIGNGGSDYIYGDEGIDVAKYTNNYSDYTLVNNTTNWTVADNINTSDVDTLYDVELLEFSNGIFDLQAETFRSQLKGTSLDDSIVGTPLDDTIYGYEGNDTISGADSNDIIIGGLGGDTLTGGAGNDSFVFNDLAEMTANSDHITDFEQGDNIDLSTIVGLTFIAEDDFSNTPNEMRYSFNNGTTTIEIDSTGDGVTDHRIIIDNGEFFLSENNGLLTIAEAPDGAIIGTAGNDTLTGTTEDDYILGLEGDDVLQGGEGNDTVLGGAGNDDVQGGAGDDILRGGEGNDVLRSQGGNDVMHGDAGNDVFVSSTGQEQMYGGAGNDVLRGFIGPDLFDGGEGIDRVWWRDYQNDNGLGYDVDLVAGTAIDSEGNQSTLVSIEDITGSVYADTLSGDDEANTIRGGADRFGLIDGADTIHGLGGDDQLFGDGGDDTIFGGEGNDFIRGGAGDDTVDGGNGNDTYYFTAGDGNDIITDAGGSDRLVIGSGISLSDLTFTADGDDLIIDIASGVTIIGQLAENSNSIIEGIEFEDDEGTIIDISDPSLFLNKAPDAIDDSFTVDEDVALSGNVLADNGLGADTDLDGDNIIVQASTVTTAQGIQVVLASDGSFIYTPTTNFNGADSFSYTIEDPSGLTDTATVNITVSAVNDAPEAQDDAFTTDEDVVLSGNVLTDNGAGLDSDVDGDNLTVQAETIVTAQGAEVIINTDGTFDYTAIENFNGADNFNYTVLDGQGGSDVGTVNVSVEAVNDNPTAQDDGFTIDEDTVLNGNVLSDNANGSDSDLDGDDINVQAGVIMTAQGVEVIMNSDGSFEYTPSTNFHGTDSFEYIVEDAGGLTDTATVNIVVNPINDNPFAQGDVFVANEAQDVSGNLLTDNGEGADSDIEGDVLSVQSGTFTSIEGGSVVIEDNGDFTYTSTIAFSGVDGFSYVLLDDQGGSANGQVDIVINDTLNDIIGSEGNDWIFGTFGDDGIYSLGGKDVVFALYGDDVIYGGDGRDYLFGGSGNDWVKGEAGNDYIVGSFGNDILEGGSGNDQLYGGFGDDILYGGEGNDFLWGFFNDNILIASEGEDILKGGVGIDSFVFKSESAFDGIDKIRNFSKSQDIIDLSDVLEQYDPLGDAITDFVEITNNGANSILSVDIDGGADNFVQIAKIEGVTGLTDEVTLEANGTLIV